MVLLLVPLIGCRMDPLVVINLLNKEQMSKQLTSCRNRINYAKHLVVGQVTRFIIVQICILKSKRFIRSSQMRFEC